MYLVEMAIEQGRDMRYIDVNNIVYNSLHSFWKLIRNICFPRTESNLITYSTDTREISDTISHKCLLHVICKDSFY